MTNLLITESLIKSEFKYVINIETTMDIEVFSEMLNNLFEIDMFRTSPVKVGNITTLNIETNNLESINILKDVTFNAINKANGLLN